MKYLKYYKLEEGYHEEKDTYEFPTVSFTEDTDKVWYMPNNMFIMDFLISEEDVLNYSGEDITIMENGSVYDSLEIEGVEQAKPIEVKSTVSQFGEYISNGGGNAGPVSISTLSVSSESTDSGSSELPKITYIHSDNWIGCPIFAFTNMKLNFEEEIKNSYTLIVYNSPKQIHTKPYDDISLYNVYSIDEIGEISEDNKSIVVNEAILSGLNEVFLNWEYLGFAILDADYINGSNVKNDAYFVDTNAIVNFTIESNWYSFEDEATVKSVTNENSLFTETIVIGDNTITGISVVKSTESNSISPYSVATVKLATPITNNKILVKDIYGDVFELDSSSYILSRDGLEITLNYNGLQNIYVLSDSYGEWTTASTENGESVIAFLNPTSPLLDCEIYYRETKGFDLIYNNEDLAFTHHEVEVMNEETSAVTIQSGYTISLPNDKLYSSTISSMIFEYDSNITEENLGLLMCVVGSNNILKIMELAPVKDAPSEMISLDVVNNTLTFGSSFINNINNTYAKYGGRFAFLLVDSNMVNVIEGSDSKSYLTNVDCIIPFTLTTAIMQNSVLNSNINTWKYDPTQTKGIVSEESWLGEPWKGNMTLTFDSSITERDTIVIAIREDGNNDWIYTRNYNYKNDAWEFENFFETIDDTYTTFKFLKDPSYFDITSRGYYEIAIYGIKDYSGSNNSSEESVNTLSNSSSDNSSNLTEDNFISCTMSGEFGGISDNITLPTTEARVYRVVGYIRRNIDDMTNMFYNYNRMINIDLRRVNTSNVTDMNHMFSGCYSLTSIDLSSFNTSNVTDMYGMFDRCIRLTSLDLSSFDTSKVTNMHDMFFSCASLTSLNLSNFDTSNVTNMRSMFSRCTGLTSLDLSNFNTSNVMSMNQMFSGCYSLTSLDLSSFDISKVTNVTGLCSGCTSLTSVTFGEKFDTSNVTDMDYMFSGCYSLTSLDLSSFDISKVTYMNYMFSGCSGITTLKYFKKTKSSVGNIKTQLGLSVLTSITSIDFSGWDTSNVTNMSGLCSGCTSLISITFGDTFNTSNVTDMRSMFDSCSGLTSLDLSSFDTSNVTNMKSMFSGCYSLTSLDLSSFVTSNVTSMQSMFNSCSGLTSLDLSSFDTSKVTTMSGMFGACTGLTSIDLSGWDTNNVIYMGSMFASCQSLTSMTQVIGFDKLNTSKLAGMHSMFYDCTNLTSIDLSSFDTSKVTDMYEMFGLCKSLTSITFGSQADVSKVTDYSYMFRYITTTGTLYYPSAYANAWNNIIVTNKLRSYFPSTWTAVAVDYENGES